MYRLLIFILKSISLLPFRFLYIFSDILSFLLYNLGIYRKKIVLENIRLAFPDKSEKEIKEICKKFYSHLCDLFVESIKFFTISQKDISKRFVFKNKDLLFSDTNENVFVFMGHYSNWEWFSYSTYEGKLHGRVGWIIYLPLTNKYMDNYIKINRSRFGGVLIPKGSVSKYIVRNRNSKNIDVYGMVMDQSPHKNEIDAFINFMGVRTPVNSSLELLSKKLDVSVYFAEIDKVKRGYYEVEFKKITDRASKTEDGYILKESYRILEEQIKRKPEYWFWTHKRWKHKDLQL